MADYLPNTAFSLLQNEAMFRFNSDTVFLGEFMMIKDHETVLDVGTNNGALLLYASRYKPQSLVGIDLYEEVLHQAKINLENNQVEATLYQTSFQDFKHESFDVIVCNPPFFKQNNECLKSENIYLKSARHQEFLTLDDLCFHMNRLLKDTGRGYLIYPSADLQQVMVTCAQNNLAVSELKLIFDENRDTSTRFLMCLKKMPYKDLKIWKSHTIKRAKKSEGPLFV